MNPRELSDIQNLLREAKGYYKMYEDMIDTSLESAHLPTSIKDTVRNLSVEEIESGIEDDTLQNHFKPEEIIKFNDNELEGLTIYADRIKEILPEFYAFIKELKENITQLDDFENEVNELESESDEKVASYYAYVNSPEYKEKRAKRIAKLKEDAANEPSEYRRNMMLKQLAAMEDADTMRFLFDRIEVMGDKEIDLICNSFFDKKKGAYILERFAEKCKLFKHNKNIYKFFFNLEQNFLGEEYYPYNNLFLFIIMRYIAYSDASNKIDTMFVNALIKKTYNLTYHKYANQEDEDAYVAVIKKMVDNFSKYHDEFVEYNSTSPVHPVRLKMEQDSNEEIRRLKAINTLDENGIEYDLSMDIETLEGLLLDFVNKTPELAAMNEMIISSDEMSSDMTDTTEIPSELLGVDNTVDLEVVSNDVE